MNMERSTSTLETSPPQAPASVSASPPLPNDVATLHAMIRELIDSLHKEQREREGVQQRLDLLLRKLYGPKAERIEHTLPEAERVCPCCNEVCPKFGEDVSEQLDYHPGNLFVNQHVRFKYACPQCHDHVTVG